GANLAPMMPEHQPQGKSTPEEMEAHRRQMKLREKAQKEADEMRARFGGG
ncbi:MAG: hypothetical protein GY721_11215, partial [Deltaproteobacteria bacterium]|nr:hypothetical protein [Deltaproteobacteria bacterium]